MCYRTKTGNKVGEFEDTPDGFGRIAATTAKQIMLQRLRDAEDDIKFGEFSGKEGDIVCNLAREKKLTNVRSSTKEAFVKLPPPRVFGIEDALEYVDDDELIEITPKSIRLRKLHLKEKDRRRALSAAGR